MLVKSTENDSLMIDMRRSCRCGCHCTVSTPFEVSFFFSYLPPPLQTFQMNVNCLSVRPNDEYTR